jgi:tetratricopeptide (TPR) repeat protein
MAPGSRLQELTAQYMQNPRRFFVPLANEYLANRDLDRAIALCREHLPAQPGHMSGHIVLGRAYFEKGDIDAAREVFTTSVSLDSENLIALRHLGDIARLRNAPDEARQWYARVVDADPQQNEEIQRLLLSLGSSTTSSPTPLTTRSATPVFSPQFKADLGSALFDPTPPGLRALTEPPEHIGSTPAWMSATPVAPTAPPLAPLAEFDLSTIGSELDLATPLIADESDAALISAIELPVGAEQAPRDAAVESGGGMGFSFDDLDQLADADLVPFEAPSALPPSAEADFSAGVSTPSAAEAVAVDEPLVPRPAFGALASLASWREAQARETPSSTPVVPPTVTPQRPNALEVMLWEADDDTQLASPEPEFVTETMAALYVQQGFLQPALDIYRTLAARDPHDATLTAKIADLERRIGRPTPRAVQEVSDVSGFAFSNLESLDPGSSDTPSVLETMYDVSPPTPVNTEPQRDWPSPAWTPEPVQPSSDIGDDWFAEETANGAEIVEEAAATAFFGLETVSAFEAASVAGAGAPVAVIALESIFGTPMVSGGDDSAAELLSELATQMVGRLPKEAPTLPVPDVLDMPTGGANGGDSAGAASPLLSFDRFFSGSGSPPRHRMDTPSDTIAGGSQWTLSPSPVVPSLSPTFGGVPVIPPPATPSAPAAWPAFEQFMSPSEAAAAPEAATPAFEPPVSADVQVYPVPRVPTPAAVPVRTPTELPVPHAGLPTRGTPTEPPTPVAPPTDSVPLAVPAEPRAAPSEFHRWLEGLS